jgi:hypothetical protein
MTEKLKIGDLRATLESAEAELANLEKRVEVLKEWIAVTRKLCMKNSKVPGTFDVPPITRSRRTKTADLAIQVLEVLNERKEPMHVKDIVVALAEKNHAMGGKKPEATLAVALSRRPDKFRKTAPNTFGVIEQEAAAVVAS